MTRRALKGGVFKGAACSSRSSSASSRSAVLLVDVFRDGLPYLDWTLLTDPPSSDPEIAGARPAILATIYMGMLLLLFVVPIGVGTAIYLEEYANKKRWYNRLLEINIQNLAAVPVDRLRHPRARVPRARARARPGAARGRDDPDAARAADGDHRRARGDPLGARLDPPGRATRSARRSGRWSRGRCCRRRSPGSRPARSSRSRARSARRRR